MRESLWEIVHMIAAELVVYHQDTSDVNLIEKTMHHIVNNDPDINDIRAWLDAQMRYAEYFERSRQTRPQIATTLALVDEIANDVASMDELAEILGWIARLVKYYDRNHTKARKVVPQQNLFVPEPPPLVAAKRPVVPKAMEPLLLPENEKTKAEAEDMFSQLQARWQQAQANEDGKRVKKK